MDKLHIFVRLLQISKQGIFAKLVGKGVIYAKEGTIKGIKTF